MLQGSEQTVRQARTLRQAMSPPEVVLWNLLRQRPAGLKFRRQHPSGPYIADFYCHEARLVVEVDGETHGFSDRPQRDKARDRWFADRGLTVLRIAAVDVFRDAEGTADAIVRVAQSRAVEDRA